MISRAYKLAIESICTLNIFHTSLPVVANFGLWKVLWQCNFGNRFDRLENSRSTSVKSSL